MLSFTRYQNPETTVIKLLKSLSINIDADTISSELEKHPDHPSLLAISEVLDSFGIENAAYRIEPDDLAKVHCPFIAQTQLNGGDFLVVNKIKAEKVIVSSEQR